MATYSLTLLSTSPLITGLGTFPLSFPGFDGHFPDRPLLPGFFHIQFALDLLALAGLPNQLARVESAKFPRPILPEQAVSISLSPRAAGVYDCSLNVGDALCSRFALHLEMPA